MKPIVAGTVVATVLALVAGKFILQSSKPEAILARFTAFVRAHKSIAVDLDFDCKWDKNESAKGFYRFGRDVGLLFDIKSTNVDYVMSQTLDGSIEQERRQKVYSEAAYPGHFFQPSPELALIGDRSFPSPLFYGALDAGLGRTKLSKLAEAEVAGHRCDVVQIDVIGADFPISFRAFVDQDGQLWRLDKSLKRDNTSYDSTLLITKYSFETRPQSAYMIDTPTGFVPTNLPTEPPPLEVGKEIPPLAVFNSQQQKVDLGSLLGQKPKLLVIVGADCKPSFRAIPFLKRLQSKIDLVVLGDSRDPLPNEFAQFAPLSSEPGSLAREIRFNGTPYFMLVGADSKLIRIWYAYDPDVEVAFEQELEKSLKKKR